MQAEAHSDAEVWEFLEKARLVRVFVQFPRCHQGGGDLQERDHHAVAFLADLVGIGQLELRPAFF